MNLKKRTPLACLLTLTGTLTLSPAQAADPGKGEALHQAHCTQCHDSSVYTRPNRFVASLPALRKQITRCELSQGLKWFDEDIESVVQYLNREFYKFE